MIEAAVYDFFSIDSTEPKIGSYGRLMNHSKKGNMVTQVVEVKKKFSTLKNLLIFKILIALRHS